MRMPEAAYFLAEDGMRTALIFFDLQEPSQIPAVAEPAFLAAKRPGRLHAGDERRGAAGRSPSRARLTCEGGPAVTW